MTTTRLPFGRFRLGSLALICCSFFSTILLRAAVTTSTTPTSHTTTKVVTTVIENEQAQLRLKLRQDSLDRVPSCQHTFSQVEIMNMHASDSVTINSIQTTPEETLLIRYDPNEEAKEDQPEQQSPTSTTFGTTTTSTEDQEDIFTYSSTASSSSSWDQRSIPQQIHTSSGQGGIVLGPGQVAIVPLAYLPRYPCTVGSQHTDPFLNDDEHIKDDGDPTLLLEDYWYAQQAPYQIAFSSTFDPDDENFSLAQPPPPKLTKVFSGTARADWEQLLKEMPPQERSNILQQQQQQSNQISGSMIDAAHQQLHQQPPLTKGQHFQQQHSQSSQQQPSSSGDHPGGNNLDDWVFQVRTTVLLETTRGPVQLPVRASSRRQNAYGLPDVIYFDQENIAAEDDINNNTGSQSKGSSRTKRTPTSSSPQPRSGRSNDSNNQKTKGVLWLDTDLAPAESRGDKESDYAEDDDDEISPSTSRNCYNVFMTNPSTAEDLLVADVALSQPDRMNLQVHGQLRAPSSSVNQWWNTVPRRKDGDGGEEPPQLGSLVIGPGEQRYVVTVCTAGSVGSTPTAAPTPNANGDWLYGNDVAKGIDNAHIVSVDSDSASDDDIAEVVERAGKSAAQAGAKLAASAKYSMGFLRIKTETGTTLVVALERLRKQCRANTGAAGGANNGKNNQPQASPSASPNKQQVYPPSYHHALYKVEMQPTEELAAMYGKAAVVPAPATPLVTSGLKSVPPRLDFSLLSSSSPTVVSYLGIHNPMDYPIKIMRSGVAVEMEDELDSTQPNPEDLGLHMSVKIKNNYLEPETVTQEALMITCSINWDKFQAHNLESLFFHGNAILRATAHVNMNYNQWIKNLVNTNSKLQQGKILITNDYTDPKNKDGSTKQTEFVLEIPLSVSMVQGKIGIMIHRTSHPFPHLWAVQSWKEGLGSVSSIFYPQKPFDIRAELDSGEGPLTEPIFGQDGIDHKLRIFANINIPSRVGNRDGDDYQPPSLQLASATVLDEDPIEGSSANQTAQPEDICGRFNVAVGPPPPDDFPFQGFNDVGLVHIEYRFPDPEDPETDGESEYDTEETELPAYPKYCYLSLTTEPFTELHQIPLIVYPGQTEITATQTPSYPLHRRNKKKKRKKSKSKGKDTTETLEVTASSANSHAVVGFDALVEWLQTSRVGSSLRRFLEDTTGTNYEWAWNKRGDQDDEHLLGKYVSSLCGKSLNLRTAHLRPILLKVGAIRHGTVESSSFYMTNHNPIPLLVSVDVGEVEGMSISLARAPTRGQGDGHNILDHFPKKRNNAIGGPYQHLVPDGEFQGHPLEGLRKFLRTTDVAQDFLSLFRFRDAISLSDRAIDRQPLLDTLYKKYAFGEFHRDPLPIRFGQDGWSRCRRRMRSPLSSRQFVEPGYDYNATAEDGDEDEDNYLTEESVRAIKAGRGPMMISDDYKQPRPLKVCWDKDAEPMEYPSDGTYTIVPPGAIARFELKLHAPPKSMLRDDITRFLSTGLVLSTDHGEILPIFVTFEALLGEVQIAKPRPVPSSSRAPAPSCAQPNQVQDETSAGNATVMQVPANLFHEVPRDMPVDDTANGVRGANTTNLDRALSLRLKSSFSRGTRLVGVSSCNPWFEVALDGNDGSHPFLPGYRESGYQQVVDIGEVKSTISCETGRKYLTTPKYPSFYQCALKWLSDQPELQPRGCGLLPSARKVNSNEEGNVGHVAEHTVIRRAVKACEKALLVSSLAFGGGFQQEGNESAPLRTFDHMEAQRQLPSRDGIVAPIVLDVFAEAWDAWRVVADYGLRKLSSTLKATIEYESSGSRPGDPSNTQNLTVAMRDTSLQTVLSAPKLFDCQRAIESESIVYSTIGDDYLPSVVEFKPTPVADFSSLTIPLKNPTAVPVRVRIATAPPSTSKTTAASTEPESLKNRFSVDDDVRNSYMESNSPPFVQSGKLNATKQHYHAGVIAEQLWWDGAGGYFLADDYGDLVRSHHNIRIMAGGGAHVSMVSPSLHSNVALLAGCGVRCGVRDEKYAAAYNQDGNDTSKLVSPIGASAAAGITLAGRVRSDLPQVNVRISEEPVFAAGASSPGGNGGPAAFAIPYSSLDEIIIPPFGEVEIGPIMFRPPGRHSVHGCQAATDSRIVSISGNGDRSKACSSNIYESMVYLENSLTGLERLTLRGRALWERLVFLDPPPADAHLGDEFGDIELRYGHSALIFSGSKANGETHSHKLEPTVLGSVIKEVVVQNLGDTLLDFESAYLSDTSKLHTKHSTAMTYRQHDSICSFKQFRLLNCFDEENKSEDEGLRNVKHGFTLEPGESISLFIEHFPDCKKANDFIALNLERRRKANLQPLRGKFGLLSKGEAQQASERDSNVVFRRRKFELLIGYDMSDDEYKSCAPVQRWSYKMSHVSRVGRCSPNGDKGCKNSWFTAINHRLRWYSVVVLRFVVLSCCIIFSYAILYRGFLYRRKSSEFFASNLTARRKTNDNGVNEKPPAQQPGIRGNWAAAFRCLARADPSSSDLQALGREQIRHVLLGRYGSMGILSPQCLSSNGVFNRERGGIALSGSPTKQIGGKEVGSGDRARTLSDVVYRHVSTPQDPHLRTSLPRGLAWRAAAARGMKLPNLSEKSPRLLRTSELHLKRVARAKIQSEAPDEEVEDEADFHRSNHSSYDDSQQSDDDSSEGEYSDDGDESQLQESYVSELSEDQGQSESPDDTSEDRNEPVEDLKFVADKNKSVPQGVAPSPPTMEAEAQPIEGAITTKPLASEDSPQEEKKIPEATNGADRKETVALNALEMKTPPRPSSTHETTSVNDTVSSSQPPKKKESKRDRDKRARQQKKTRAQSPLKTDDTEIASATSPQPKRSQSNDSEAKSSDFKTPTRPTKGKAAAEKQTKQGGKVNQTQREKKINPGSPDLKTSKAADAEEKSSNRRNKKNDPSGTSKQGTNKETPAGKSSQNEKKKKGSAGKKGKKGRSGKATAQGQAESRDEGTLVAAETSLQTTPSQAQSSEARPLLRPPPGLAPPPGFGAQDGAAAASPLTARPTFGSPLLPPSAFLSDTSILGSPSSTVLGTPARSLGGTAFGGLSPSLINAETPLRGGITSSLPPSAHSAAGEALLASVTNTPLNRPLETSFQSSRDSTEGFDVMDFLDSILNEGNSAAAPPPVAPDRGPDAAFLGAAGSGATTPVPPLSSTPVQPIFSSDPWATERQSRASAYGIAIDEAATKEMASPSLQSLGDGSNMDSNPPPLLLNTISGGSNQEGNNNTPIPLLNTAAILYASDVRDDDDDDEEEDNGDSFYAGLLAGLKTEDEEDKGSLYVSYAD